MDQPTLAELQPILAELGRPPVREITRFQGGTAAVYRLDLMDGTRLVLKTFDGNHLVPRKDQYAAGLLENLDIVATRYLRVDESLTHLPVRFALTTYIEGERANSSPGIRTIRA